MKKYPKVSVVTITYGHENYIIETIKGVLMQEYQGDIEFIIANDNSPDDTDKLVREFFLQNSVPANFEIKYTNHKVNKGMMPNFIWALEQASGKYVAICEGDDYWVDPLKLQKQVDFLEENKNYVLCFTDREILKINTLEITASLHNQFSFNKAEIPYIHIPTLTVVFRNVENKIPRQMHDSLIDTSLFIFLSQFGKFYFFRDKTAVYRVHDNGMYSGNSDFINFGRSAKARLYAWIYLKDVDKVSLADNLIFCYRLKKNSAIKEKYFLSALSATVVEYFFSIYLFVNKKLLWR